MTKTLGRYFPALVVVALLLPLLAMAYLGQYSRFIADDYCWAAAVQTQGLVNAFTTWYTTWEGRFTHMVVKGVIGLLGANVTPYYPTLILSGWLLVMGWGVYQLMLAIRLPHPKLSALVLSLLILFATFAGTPSLIQSLYWTTGSVPYVGGLLLLTFLAGFLVYSVRLHPNKTFIIAAAVVALVSFTAGGLSEGYVALQTAAFGLAFLGTLVFAPARYKRPALVLLSIGIVCSLAALLVMAAAPGNAVRRAQFPTLPITLVAWRTFYITISYTATAAGILSPIPLIVSVLLPMLFFYRLEPLPAHLRLPPRVVRLLLLLSALTAFVLVAASIAPAIYATSYAPAARAYVMPQFILIGTAVFWGVVMGLGARRSQPRVSATTQFITALIIVALLIVGPLAFARHVLTDIPDFRAYAIEWDSRDAVIRAAVQAGERRIQTMMLKTDIGIRAALEPIGPEAQTGVNRCAAQYYGVDALTAQTRLQMGSKLR